MTIAKFAYLAAAAWLAVCFCFGISTFKSPVYLWHASQLMTRDGLRVIATRGVCLIEIVDTSGAWSLSNGKMALSASIYVANSSVLSASYDEDRAIILRHSDWHHSVMNAQITLRGGDLANGGGFERSSMNASGAGSSLAVNVYCLPIWFISLVPGVLAATIGVTSWLTRRTTRRIGFPVAPPNVTARATVL